jgi:MtfA peptidase
MVYLGVLLLIVISLLALNFLWGKKKWEKTKNPFPPRWRNILEQKVAYYNGLSPEEKKRFELLVQEFLLNYKITGIETDVELTDRILVAASAVIPIFGFSNWHYPNLNEVLLYPSMFNDKFETSGEDRNILGMVGTGYMNGKMILSKPALRQGFSNESDKKNTAIHEFVHLLDKSDGSTDGMPQNLLQKQYTIPWLSLMQKKMEQIYAQTSDINPYGGTNPAEFFAVSSEYFFERPHLLARKHPELYQMLERIFHQDLDHLKLEKKKIELGRNSPCPCNSGKKFKHCCGKE